MKKNLLLVQPGRLGDIIICLPIVKYYVDKGFEVDWYCPLEYHSMFRNISYCKPINEVSQNYYDVMDLSFGFGGGPELWWQLTKPRWKSFIEAKYHLAHTPLEEKWNLVWDRDTQREEELFNKLDLPDEYLVYHDEGSHGAYNIELPPDIHRVKFSKREDYNVFDWYLVLEKATQIHCVDSILCNFVDVAFPTKENRVFHDIRHPPSSSGNPILRGWEEKHYENQYI